MVGVLAVVVFFLWVLTCFSSTNPLKILLLPGNMNSHIHTYVRFGQKLAELGHKTHLIVPFNAKVATHLSNENFSITTFMVDAEIPFPNSAEMSQAMMDMALTTSLLTLVSTFNEIGIKIVEAGENEATRLWGNNKTVEEIKQANYDFAVIDPTNNYLYSIPYYLDIPYATYVISIFPLAYRVPRLPSFVPFPGLSDNMNFKQRLGSFAYEAFMDLLLHADDEGLSNFIKKYVPGKPVISKMELIQNSAIWIYLEDISLGYPVPNMPNTVSIGDIMAQPANPLPADLQQYLDDSPDGVIVICFGSFFDFIPENIARKFCNAFRNVTFNVIWKQKFPEYCSGVSNVKILPWIPQNDLLSSPKVRIFISHGGYSSMAEAVHHATPVIVFPIAWDQPAQAVIAETRGFGLRMDISNFKSEELVQNINIITSNKSFQDQARRASAIMTDKPESPAERVSFLMEHVIKYGDSHLRTGAFKLSIAQFLMFDIFIFIVVLIIILLVVMITLGYCFCRISRKLYKNTKNKAD